MENLKLGDRVKVLGKNAKGEVAFIGDTHFSEGTWLGIILDEPKGRNNGTINGKRYFKCPRNHGVFVRCCQVEKYCSDGSDISLKSTTGMNNRIIYPNYLKYSSKYKAERHRCRSVSKDHAQKSKSQTKQQDLQLNAVDSTKPSLMVKQAELDKIKEENQLLQTKLNCSEESSRDISKKYTKALEEIKSLKEKIEADKKLIDVLKCRLKLVKINRSRQQRGTHEHFEKQKAVNNRLKTVESHNYERKLKGIEEFVNNDLCSKFEEDDFEKDTDTINEFSAQRLRELEKQNKIMKQGLIEVRKFLKSCEVHGNDTSFAANFDEKELSNCNKAFQTSHDVSAGVRIDCLSEKKNSVPPRRCCSDFFRVDSHLPRKKAIQSNYSNDRLDLLNEERFGDLKEYEVEKQLLPLSQNLGNKVCSVSSSNEHFDSSFFPLKSENFPDTLNAINTDFQNYWQAVENKYSVDPFVVTRTSSRQPEMHHKNDIPSNNVNNPVKELQNLISHFVSKAENMEEFKTTSAKESVIQQDILVEVQGSTSNSSSARSSRTQSRTEVPLKILDKPVSDLHLQSTDWNSHSASKQKKPKRRMLYSTRIYQRNDELENKG